MFKYKILQGLLVGFIVVIFTACGGSGSSGGSTNSKLKLTGSFINVDGLNYTTSSGLEGQTDSEGKFLYYENDTITFSTKGAKLGTVDAKDKITVFSFTKPLMISQLLHTLDEDADSSNGIKLIDASDIVSLSNQSKKTRNNYTIDIQSLSSYDESYMNFLKRHGTYIAPKSEAFVNDAISQLKLPVKRSSNSYIYRAIGGDYKIPVERFNKHAKVEELLKSDLYNYRLALAVTHKMYLEMVLEQQKIQDKVIDDADALAGDVNVFSETVMYAVNTALNTATFDVDDDLKSFLVSQAADTYKSTLVSLDEFTPEAKLASSVLFDCASNLGNDGDLRACAVGVVGASIDKVILEHLSQQYPIASGILTDLSGLAVDLGSTALSCSKNMASSECVKDATNALLGQSLKFVGESLKIYKLGKSTDGANSKAIALEIFLASKYLNIPSITNNYCGLAKEYGANEKICRKMTETVGISGGISQYENQLRYIANKVVESSKVKELTSGALDSHADFNLDVIKTNIEELQDRYIIIRTQLSKKLKKYRDINGKVNNDKVAQRIAKEVVVSQPTMVETSKTLGGNIDIRSCVDIYTKRAIKNVNVSLVLYDDQNSPVSARIESHPHAWNSDVKHVCGTFDDYSPFVGEQTGVSLPFVIVAKADFSFINTSGKKFSSSNSALFDFSIELVEEKDPSIDFSYEYDKTLNSYLLKGNVDDGNNQDKNYKYQWNIAGPKECIVSQNDTKNYALFPLPKECFDHTLTASVSLYENGKFIAKNKKYLDPVLADTPQPLSLRVEPLELQIALGEEKEVSLTFVGGTPPYKVDNINVPEPFNVSVVNNMKLYITSTKNVNELTQKNVIVNVTDKKGKQAQKTLSLHQSPLAEMQIPTIATSSKNKKPYSNISSPATIATGESIQQNWWLQNSTSTALNGVILKQNDKYCTSNLSHNMKDIVIGRMEPNAIVRPVIQITEVTGTENVYNYCQWDIYHQEDGVLKRLRWARSKRTASINYYFKTKKEEIVLPQIPQNLSMQQREDGVLISWDAIEDAKKYILLGAIAKDGVFMSMNAASESRFVSATSFLLSKRYFEKTKTRYFTVRADNGDMSDVVAFTWKDTIVSVPTTTISLDATQRADGVLLSWNAIEGTSKYTLYTTMDGTENGSLMSMEGSATGEEWLSDTSFLVNKSRFDTRKTWWFAVSTGRVTDISKKIKFTWKDTVIPPKPISGNSMLFNNEWIYFDSHVMGKDSQFKTQEGEDETFEIGLFNSNSNHKLFFFLKFTSTQEFLDAFNGDTLILYADDIYSMLAFHVLNDYVRVEPSGDFSLTITKNSAGTYNLETVGSATNSSETLKVSDISLDNLILEQKEDGGNLVPQMSSITYRGNIYPIQKSLSGEIGDEVEISLMTGQDNLYQKGGLRFAFHLVDNLDLRMALKDSGVLYLRDEVLNIQFSIENDISTDVTFRSGSIKLTWLGYEDKFSIEQNGASLIISSKDTNDNIAYPIYFTKTIVQLQTEAVVDVPQVIPNSTTFTIPEIMYYPYISGGSVSEGGGQRTYNFEYQIISFSADNIFSQRTKELVNGVFVDDDSDEDLDNALEDEDFVLRNGEWVLDTYNDDSTSFLLNSDNKEVLLKAWNKSIYKQGVIDISGHSIAFEDTGETIVMPSGAQKIRIKIVGAEDEYSIWWEARYATLEEVVEKQCGYHTSIEAKYESGLKGISFTCNQEGQTSGTLMGIRKDDSIQENVGTWKITNLPNSTIPAILVAVQPLYVEDPNESMIYAIKDGKVWEGSVELAGERENEAWYNKIAMDAFKSKMKSMPSKQIVMGGGIKVATTLKHLIK